MKLIAILYGQFPKKKMNILFVLEYFYPQLIGGEERNSWKISNALSKRGHNVFVITSKMDNIPEYELLNGIKVFRPFASGGVVTRGGISGIIALLKRAFFAVRLYPYLKEFLKQYPIDIIYNHAYVPTMPTTYLASERGIPVITAIRALAGQNWFQLTNPALALFGYLTEIVTLRFAKHTALYCPSREVARKVKAHTSARVLVIPNPLDLDEISEVRENTDCQIRQSLGIKEEEQFLLFVGSLVKVKNVDGLIKALSNLRTNFKLVIVGEGSERPKIEKLAKGLGLKDKVILLGQKPHKETLGIMNSCDVFLLPSKSEVFPNTILEALALGKPAIATKIGGIPEIKSENLYLIGNIGEINQLLEDGIEPKEDERILEEYSMDKIIDRFENMLQGEIESNGR